MKTRSAFELCATELLTGLRNLHEELIRSPKVWQHLPFEPRNNWSQCRIIRDESDHDRQRWFSRNFRYEKRAFLAASSRCGSLSEASKLAKVDRRTHYNWLKDNLWYLVRTRFPASGDWSGRLAARQADGNGLITVESQAQDLR